MSFVTAPAGAAETGEGIAAKYEGLPDRNPFTDASALKNSAVILPLGRFFSHAGGEGEGEYWQTSRGFPVTPVDIADAGAIQKRALSVQLPAGSGFELVDQGVSRFDVAGRRVFFSVYVRCNEAAAFKARIRYYDNTGATENLVETVLATTDHLTGKRYDFAFDVPENAIHARAQLLFNARAEEDTVWTFTDLDATRVEVTSPAYIAPNTPGDVNLARHGKLSVSAERDTAAWLEAWEAIDEAGGGRLTLPPGRFEIGERATITTDYGYGPEKGLALFGAGAGNTTLVNAGNGGLFSWSQSTARDITFRSGGFHILLAAGGDNGNLVELEAVPGGDHHHRDAVFNDISILPNNPAVDYMTRGLWLKGVHRPMMISVLSSNPFGPGVITEIQQQGEAVFDLADCYGHHFGLCYAWGTKFGYRAVATIDPGAEGGWWVDCVGDAETGYYLDTPGKESGGGMRGCHANYGLRGAVIKNRRNFTIDQFLTYHEEATEGADLELINCDRIDVGGMHSFYDDADDFRTAVLIDENCDKITFSRPRINGGGKGFEIAAGAGEVTILDPEFGGDVTTRVDDQGAGKLRVRYGELHHLRASLSAVQNIGQAVDTTVAFDTVDEKTGGLTIQPDGGIVVPSGWGYSRVKVRANVQWASNDTGFRELKITKNTVQFAGSGHILREAEATSYMGVESATVAVEGGDVLRLVARQNSGTGQNIVNVPGTWIEVEVVQ